MLLAMSNLFDAKLEPLKKEIQDVRTSLEGEIKNVQGSLEGEIKSVKNSLGGELRNIKLTLENEIIPRLQTIENCYITTYQRYASGINELEALKADVEILKKVAAEHSKKLQKIS